MRARITTRASVFNMDIITWHQCTELVVIRARM